MPPISDIDQQFRGECLRIINGSWDQNSLEKLFKLTAPYAAEDITRSFRRLALQFHPDKNKNNFELADKVTSILVEMRNSLLSKKPFQARIERPKNATRVVDLSITELLDALEEKNIHLDSLALCKQELKRRILQDKNLLEATSCCQNTPLYLAAQLNDCDLFSWLYKQGADPLFSVNTQALCPLHRAIARAEETQDYAILNFIQAQYGDDKYRNNLIKTLATLKGPVFILQYCIDELKSANYSFAPQQHNSLVLDITHGNSKTVSISLDQNPFLVNTSLGGHLERGLKFDFIKKHLKNYPGLYASLTKDQKTDPFCILAFCSAYQEFYPALAANFLISLPQDGLSAYFIKALFDKFPTLKEAVEKRKKHPESPLFHPILSSKIYFSMERGFQLAILSCIGIMATALALAIAFPAIAVEGAPIVFAVGLGLFLCFGLFLLGGECKRYYEKTKINTLLSTNNFFKPERKSPFAFYDIEAKSDSLQVFNPD